MRILKKGDSRSVGTTLPSRPKRRDSSKDASRFSSLIYVFAIIWRKNKKKSTSINDEDS